MNVALRNTEPVTPEEFEAMAKDEWFNYELIDGVVMMSPSPSREHQGVSMNIAGHLFILLKNTPCKPLFELDIQYKGNVLKPDVMVFCESNDDLPEIVFEILSPSTRRKDLVTKVIRYEEMGIKEYWIIDPKVKSVTIHDYINGTADSYAIGDTIQSQIRPEIIITVADIFA